MKEALITIVLPIYNVERYLERCLESVVNQSYKNLEIILVDDGSPDNCPIICDDWAKKDERIRVIHKRNAGLGMARNTGIENAKGEYICFFDSDDYVDTFLVEKAYNVITKEKADIVLFGFKRIAPNGEIKGEMLPFSNKLSYIGEEVQKEFLPDLIDSSCKDAKAKNLPLSAWSCIYSTQLIKSNNWKFVSERVIISEDSFSLVDLYKYVQKVVILPEALYNYCENQNSLSTSFRKDRFEKLKFFYSQIMILIDGYPSNTVIKRRVSSLFFSYYMGALKQIVKMNEGFKQKYCLIKEMVLDSTVQEALARAEKKYVSVGKSLFNFAVRKKLCFLVYVFLKLKIKK